MTIKRIVSFLPSATELLYELGVENDLYGVTHECKYPKDVLTKQRVINSVINSDELTSKEIDILTCQLINEKKDIFVLDEKKLKFANPDLIISQETCKVCAAYTNQVERALEILKNKPQIYSMNPHNIQEILNSVKELGKILKKENKAEQIVNSLEQRIKKIRREQNRKSPNVLAIEWIDPFFTAGHWIPEMIKIAGGVNMISRTSEQSKRLDFDKIIESDPDIIILMPCGFDLERTIIEYNNTLKKNKKWHTLRAVINNQVFAVNADSFFSKPSIRTIGGLEILAKIIQPEKFQSINVGKESYIKIQNQEIGNK